MHSRTARSPNTVIRSVRDIDRNQRRKYLYTIPLVHAAAAVTSNAASSSSTSSSTATPATTTTAAAVAATKIDKKEKDCTTRAQMMTIRIPPSELSEAVQLRLPSPSGQRVAFFCKGANNNNNSGNESRSASQSTTTTTLLEIWNLGGQSLDRRIDLSASLEPTTTTCMGAVVVDAAGGFGLPSWNARETAIVFSAERRCESGTTSYFAAADNNSMRGQQQQNTLGIGKTEHWGEKYSNQSPLFDLYCVNVETGRVGRVDNVPGRAPAGGNIKESSSSSLGGFSLGQAVFDPTCGNDDTEASLVYTGWDAGGGLEMPRRLGLVYCQQRPCKLYHSNIAKLMQRLASATVSNDIDDDSDGGSIPDLSLLPFTELTPDHRMSFSPRFSPAETKHQPSKLVFLTSIEGFDTHSGCLSLGLIERRGGCSNAPTANLGNNPYGSPKILVEQVWDDASSSSFYDSMGNVAGMRFPGLYMQQLPVAPFLSPEFLLLTTHWGSCLKTVRVSLTDGSLQLVSINSEDANDQSSDEVLFVSSNEVAICSKTPRQPGILHILRSCDLCRESPKPLSISPLLSLTFPPIASSIVTSAVPCAAQDLTFVIRSSDAPKIEGVACNHPLQSILLLPNKELHPKPPLIVIPHGGPHSVSSTTHVPSYGFLCSHGGYALLLVNYRGSTGFGQSSIVALPGQIGTMDVKDVISATCAVKESGLVDSTRIGICGGSHGGFLTAHVTSQYPKFFRAAVMRNPVVNLASMVTTTDIPDWCHVEAGGSLYNWKEYKPPTLEEVVSFYKKSPVQYIRNVETPTLVALGMKDLRVPPSQGLEWYHSLRSMGVLTKLLMYDNDDHAIDGVASDADHWVNIKRWFDEHL